MTNSSVFNGYYNKYFSIHCNMQMSRCLTKDYTIEFDFNVIIANSMQIDVNFKAANYANDFELT